MESAILFKATDSEIVDQQVFETLNLLKLKIESLGYPCRTESKKSLQIFNAMSEAQKRKVLLQLECILRIVAVPSGISIVPGSDHPEKLSVEQALNFYGLEFRDEFWTQVQKDDVIEIYNQDQIQVFRTLNFFRITGYSLLDLLTIEWFDLWSRSSVVLTTLLGIAQKTLAGQAVGVNTVEVPSHVVKEIYNTDQSDHFAERSAYAKFKLIGPVYRIGLPIVGGFVITCEGRLLSVGDEATKISFI